MPTIIIGGGVFAKELACYLSGDAVFVADSFDECFNDYPYQLQQTNLEEYIIGSDGWQGAHIYLGSGHPNIKMRMYEEIKQHLSTKFRIGPYFNVMAMLSPHAKVGAGSVSAPGAIISPCVKIGENILINYGATIGHDTAIRDFATISPNASIGGNCIIGKAAYIGAGAMIKERVHIGESAIIGMGAIVLKDVPPHHIAVGNPAKIYSKEEWEEKKS